MYGITDSSDMNLSKLSEIVKDREGWRAAVRKSQLCPLEFHFRLSRAGRGCLGKDGFFFSQKLGNGMKHPDLI